MPRLRFLAALILVLAALSAPSARCAAADGLAQAPDRPLILGSPEEGWPPYHIPDPGDDRSGIMPDILTQAAAALGLPVVVRRYPDKRCMKMLEEGTIDAYTKAYEWVEEPERFAWSRGVVLSEDMILLRAGGTLRYSRPSDLRGLRVGTVLGYGYPRLEALFAGGGVLRDDAPGVVFMLRKLAGGRTDAAVSNRLVAQWVMRNDPALAARGLVFADTPLDCAWFRYVFTRVRDWGPTIAGIDAEIERMRRDGRLDAILARYR